jgi:hypothetical protein
MAQISGVNEYQRGASEMKRTATEAAMVQDASNTRSADKLAIIEIAIGRIASRVLALAQQFMTGEQVVRVVGSEAQQVWIPFTYEDIKGEFDFTVEGGSTQPQNEATRRQQAIAMMNSLGPMIGTVIDPAAIAKHVLQFGFGIKTPGKFLMQQPPPMAPGMPPEGAQTPGGAPMPSEMSAPQPPQGQGVDAPQMDPRELLMLQQNQGNSQGLTQPGGGGVPPALLRQLQGQMGLQ